MRNSFSSSLSWLGSLLFPFFPFFPPLVSLVRLGRSFVISGSCLFRFRFSSLVRIVPVRRKALGEALFCLFVAVRGAQAVVRVDRQTPQRSIDSLMGLASVRASPIGRRRWLFSDAQLHPNGNRSRRHFKEVLELPRGAPLLVSYSARRENGAGRSYLGTTSMKGSVARAEPTLNRTKPRPVCCSGVLRVIVQVDRKTRALVPCEVYR